MTAVRPPIFPTQPNPAGPVRPDAARAAAQKAFFDLAMGKAAAPTQVAAQTGAGALASSAPAVAAVPTQRIPDAGAEKPQRILRPGSLLDIRI